MDLRPYLPADRNACLAIFDSNTPRLLSPVQHEAFEQFLNAPNCPYFVMEHEGIIVGSGGYFLESKSAAKLVWGIVESSSQKLGLGRFLLLYRLREIGKAGAVELVRGETSQHSASFFEKQGLKISTIVPDGISPGFDRVELVKRLVVCA